MRKAVVTRFPYIVLYQDDGTEVVVISVFHSSRDPSIWQGRVGPVPAPDLGVPYVGLESRMIAFVVSVNGQRVGTFGVGDSGVLSAHVTWVNAPGDAGDLSLSVSGLDTLNQEHVRWPEPEFNVGDTVTVQVIEADAVDAPVDRKTVEQAAEEFEARRAKAESRQGRSEQVDN